MLYFHVNIFLNFHFRTILFYESSWVQVCLNHAWSVSSHFTGIVFYVLDNPLFVALIKSDNCFLITSTFIMELGPNINVGLL